MWLVATLLDTQNRILPPSRKFWMELPRYSDCQALSSTVGKDGYFKKEGGPKGVLPFRRFVLIWVTLCLFMPLPFFSLLEVSNVQRVTCSCRADRKQLLSGALPASQDGDRGTGSRAGWPSAASPWSGCHGTAEQVVAVSALSLLEMKASLIVDQI